MPVAVPRKIFVPAVTGASVTAVATIESGLERIVIELASSVSDLPVAVMVELALTFRLPALTWIVVFWVTVTWAGVLGPVPMLRSPLWTTSEPLLRLVGPTRSVLDEPPEPPMVVSVKPSRSTPPSSVIVAPVGSAPALVVSSVALPVSLVASSVSGAPAVRTEPIRNVLPDRGATARPPLNSEMSVESLPRPTNTVLLNVVVCVTTLLLPLRATP